MMERANPWKGRRIAMITIDGSQGEGGGQILRTTLSLSLLTGIPFTMVRIRAGREKPGLRPQHLQAILACQRIAQARVEGARIGSTEIRFWPGKVRGGEYRFDIGTAGATSLLLHTLFLPLSFAEEETYLWLRGGTHVPWSPTYEFLAECWLYFMRRLGFDLDLRLLRAGFYPQGGGEMEVWIRPVKRLFPLQLLERGALLKITGYSAQANLKEEVALRQARYGKQLLKQAGFEVEMETATLPSLSRNTTFALTAYFTHSRCCYTALGARGKRAEKVAEEACQKLLHFLRQNGAVDEYMADQLILPLAWAGHDSSFSVSTITSHLLTNIHTVSAFLPVKITVQGELGSEGTVTLTRGEGGRETACDLHGFRSG
ncbi:MAG: RNA 3'-phosphate cyclase [Nitrospinota bacterium]|nr:MAG: RNA 3'-phosphate cyclase [Nitrospinota bacterium]